MNLLPWVEFLFFTAVLSDKTITCYGFGGLEYPNNTRCPGSNSCCGVEATCLSNRLCHKPNDGPDTYVRGPCSINPYDSGTCAQICLYNETTGVLPRVRTCSDGSYCCDNDDHCCDDGNGIFLDAEGKISDQSPSVVHSYGPERTASTFRMSVSTPSTTIIQSPTTSSADTLPTTSLDVSLNAESGEDDQLGVKIGFGVGIPVGVLVISGVGAWFWWRNRGTGSGKPVDVDMCTASHRMANEAYTPGNSLVVKHELPGSQDPVELDGYYHK